MQKSRGITLSEVLLVAGLLIAGGIVLWIIGARANERLMARSCAGHVRDLAEALAQYSYDHDGYVPPFTNLESDLAAQRHSSPPTNSQQPQRLAAALHIYSDPSSWFCPFDPVAEKAKYYLGIRHQFSSYAFPLYRDKNGHAPLLSQIPNDLAHGLVFDAAGDRNSCERSLWYGGTRAIASNHPDGYVNAALPDLSIHYLPAEEGGKALP